MKKWLLTLLLPLALFADPLQDLLDRFGITASQTEELWLQNGKERWEFDKRNEERRSELWPLFNKMGLIEEKTPQKQTYRYALVLGALATTMEKRLSYLEELHTKGVRFDEVVFLVGERPLQAWEIELTDCSTEAEAARWVYEKSSLERSIPVRFISVPMKQENGSLARPSTRDTVVSWLNTDPQPGSCLALSNQPFTGYQAAVLESVLGKDFPVEAVGPKAEETCSVALVLDCIAKEIKNRK
jgi:hypothetical protein